MHLQSTSITWISVQTLQNIDTSSLFEISLDRQLPKGIIPLDMLHNISHKQPCDIVIPLLSMAHTDVELLKNTVLGLFNRVNDANHIQELSWESTTINKNANTTSQESQSEKLLPAYQKNPVFKYTQKMTANQQ